MMNKIKVIVADDDEGLALAMKERVEGVAADVLDGEVLALSGKRLSDAVDQLLDRQRRVASGAGWSPRYDGLLDGADVLVMDYDLTSLYEDSPYLTGEIVALLARSFSQAGIIVSVNRHGPPVFDLQGHGTAADWADLSISHEDLSVPGLWGHSTNGTYCPWYWPVLPEAARLFDEQITFANRHWDQPIGRSLGIPAGVSRVLPTPVHSRFGDPAEATFLDAALRLLAPKEGPKLQDVSRTQLMRTAAAGVAKWLRQDVLPGQDILVDAPHLATLYPSLVKDTSVESLNGLAQKTPESDHLGKELLGHARLKHSCWMDRPVWWTEQVLDNRGIFENVEPWSKTDLPLVFAEDTSSFERSEDCVDYRSAGLFARRYVRRSSDANRHADYQPVRDLLAS